MLNTGQMPEQYEAADRDFFVYRSMFLHDTKEEAFLVRIRRWLQLADSALGSEPLFAGGNKSLRDLQNARGRPLHARPTPSSLVPVSPPSAIVRGNALASRNIRVPARKLARDCP